MEPLYVGRSQLLSAVFPPSVGGFIVPQTFRNA